MLLLSFDLMEFYAYKQISQISKIIFDIVRWELSLDGSD